MSTQPMLPNLVPSLYGDLSIDVAAFRQLGFVARKTATELASDATRSLPRGRGSALRAKANKLVEQHGAALAIIEEDTAPRALAALDAIMTAIRSNVREAAEALAPARALEPEAAPGFTPAVLSSPGFLRNMQGLSALVDGMKLLADGIPELRVRDPDEMALWAAEFVDAEPDMLEYLAAAWADRLAERLPAPMLKKADLEKITEERMTLRQAAGEARDFPFVVAREGFLGLPVVVTGIDEDDNVTGFTTAALIPDLHYGYDDEWRRSMALRDADKPKWSLIDVDPSAIGHAIDLFEEMTAEPHVARYLAAVSPAAAAETVGVSTVKMNTWLRDQGLLEYVERKNTISAEGLKRGVGFVEQTKFGPQLLFDAHFVEALADRAEEMAATKRKALPPEPPSWNQINYARKLADKLGVTIPEECLASKKTCSDAIDLLKKGLEPITSARHAHAA